MSYARLNGRMRAVAATRGALHFVMSTTPRPRHAETSDFPENEFLIEEFIKNSQVIEWP